MKQIQEVFMTQKVIEGKNLKVNRSFPSAQKSELGPFLLLDELGPMDLKGEIQETPDHPHAGFEILSYIMEGSVKHQDSLGNQFELKKGDVQWMTAGSGIVHKESFSSKDNIHAIQLWINLSNKDRNTEPQYQSILADQIPIYKPQDASYHTKVIVGELNGVKSPIQPKTKVQYLHYFVSKDRQIQISDEIGSIGFIHILKGSVFVDGVEFSRDQIPVFKKDIAIRSIDVKSGTEFIYLSGPEMLEPLARYGPFVMSNRREITDKIKAYERGDFGGI
ncbi:pirin family protein [bacterium]|nr:pirin family protein [bacterium]